MVAAKGDDAGKGAAFFRGPGLVGVGVGWPGEEGGVALFNLLDGVGVVVAVWFYSPVSVLRT